MGYHQFQEERKKLIFDINRFCNDRARLEAGLRRTLERFGIQKLQVDTIIKDVRLADFRSLDKATKHSTEKP